MARTSESRFGWLTRIGRNHCGLLALLAVYVGVTLIYGRLNPLGEAPDEIAHMDLIRFIGEEGHLPRTDTERQAAVPINHSPFLETDRASPTRRPATRCF